MVSWTDLISLPDLGEVLQGLRVNDELSDHKFYRGYGVILSTLGVLLFFLFQVLGILVTSALFFLANIALLLLIAGIAILVVSFILGKRHRELDIEEREAGISHTESKANKNNADANATKRRYNMRDTLRGRQEEDDLNDTDSEHDSVATTTIESEDG